MLLNPFHDQVSVGRIEGDAKASSAIIIPNTAKEKRPEGEIVAFGAHAKDEDGECIAREVDASDHILIQKWSAAKIALDGEDLMIMKESDIFGVMA